jgi:hypothetical protein
MPVFATPAPHLKFPAVERSSAKSTATGFFPTAPGMTPVHITKVTVTGNEAVVAFENGHIESTAMNGELVLRRFDFGWQTVAVRAPGIHPPACTADSGDPAAVTAVRRELLSHQQEAIGPVVVQSGYALVHWWGNGGGEDAYEHRGTEWHRISGGGGTLTARELESSGVPNAIAERLFTLQTKC